MNNDKKNFQATKKSGSSHSSSYSPSGKGASYQNPSLKSGIRQDIQPGMRQENRQSGQMDTKQPAKERVNQNEAASNEDREGGTSRPEQKPEENRGSGIPKTRESGNSPEKASRKDADEEEDLER